MFKMILKSALICSLLVFNGYAQAGQSKDVLANRCQEIAQTVNSLVSKQRNATCIDKLFSAYVHINSAGAFILEDSAETAKSLLDDAVSALDYAQFNSCNYYIQISHSRLEAHKLRQLL